MSQTHLNGFYKTVSPQVESLVFYIDNKLVLQIFISFLKTTGMMEYNYVGNYYSPYCKIPESLPEPTCIDLMLKYYPTAPEYPYKN